MPTVHATATSLRIGTAEYAILLPPPGKYSSPPRTKGAEAASCFNSAPAKATMIGSVTITDWSLAARWDVFDWVMQMTNDSSLPARSPGNTM
eukprot:6491981-Amphidinium_carterae.2